MYVQYNLAKRTDHQSVLAYFELINHLLCKKITQNNYKGLVLLTYTANLSRHVNKIKPLYL